MLKSPIKLSTRGNCKDYQLTSGVTLVNGVPIVDAVNKLLTLTGDADHVDTTADTITFDDPHGLQARDALAWELSAGTLPAGIGQLAVYYAIIVDDYTIQLTTIPGSTALNLTTTGSGALTVARHLRAKYVLVTNYGAYPVGIRPIVGPTYTMDTDDEFVLRHDTAKPLILNVSGYDSIACESIGGAGDIRIIPLENF